MKSKIEDLEITINEAIGTNILNSFTFFLYNFLRS